MALRLPPPYAATQSSLLDPASSSFHASRLVNGRYSQSLMLCCASTPACVGVGDIRSEPWGMEGDTLGSIFLRTRIAAETRQRCRAKTAASASPASATPAAAAAVAEANREGATPLAENGLAQKRQELGTEESNHSGAGAAAPACSAAQESVLAAAAARAAAAKEEVGSCAEWAAALGGEQGEDPYPSCPKWRRVLLKVSGEALAGDGTSNIDPKVTASISKEVALITRLGVQVAIVVGGGNFFRGAAWAGASGLDRASADHIGMMATVMNAIFLQGSLEAIGVPTRVQTAFKMSEVAEPYIRRRAIRHLEKGRVVIFAAGTGNPFFTTDTAAALRAAEIDAEVVLKGTNVDGVYDCDPKKNSNAQLLRNLSLREVTVQNLRVMDITAVTLCAENNIPVVVFNLNQPGNITRALSGEPVGTLVAP